METLTRIKKEKEIRRKLDLLLRTGEILVASGADTSRIHRNMHRTAAFLGLPEENLHIYVNYNMLQVNLSDETHSLCKFQRCDEHGINMQAISEISKLSWRAIREDYSLDEYERQMEEIHSWPRNYTVNQVSVGAGLACGGFCIQFGCDWTAFFYASIAAMIGFRLRSYLNKTGSNSYVNIGIAAFVSTIIAWLTAYISMPIVTDRLPEWLAAVLHSDTPWHPLMACALFIVPGVPLINFVSDMIENHIEVGLNRAINTLLMVTAMSFGISMAITVCGVDNFVKDLSMTPHNTYLSYSIAAAISAMGFSMIFNIPRRLLWVVAVGGIIAVCTRNFVNLGASNNNVGLDQGPIMAALVGSLLVSVLCVKFVHVFHTPHHCLAIPSVIPMVPGVLMYRALFALIEMQGVVGELTEAFSNAVKASLIILCIAIGVAIPNIYARRWLMPMRKQKLNNLILKRQEKRIFASLDKD